MEYGIESVKSCLLRMADAAIRSKGLLTLLDSVCGDGDLGISMSMGASVISRVVSQYHGDSIGELLNECAVSFGREAPSTMGTLICKALSCEAVYLRTVNTLTEEMIVKMPYVFSTGIMLVGGAVQGDKTVLDALIPLAEELNRSFEATNDLQFAARAACKAAIDGAKGTKGMLARIGRAKWFAERSRNCPDGGGVFCALMMQAAVREEPLTEKEWFSCGSNAKPD